MWLLLAIMPVASHISSCLSSNTSHFTRRQGLWKRTCFFPATFLLHSMTSLSPQQAFWFVAHKPGQARLMKQPSPTQIVFPTITPGQAFTLLVAPKCPHKSFFHKDIFEFPLFEDHSDIDEPVPPSLLHLTGVAKEWTANFTVIDPFFSASKDDDDSTCAHP